MPPLALLVFVYYSGLPFAGGELSPLGAVTLAFLLNSSAYDGEIFRAGIASVGRGQMETARSTDLAAAFHLGLLWSRVRLSSRLERRLAT